VLQLSGLGFELLNLLDLLLDLLSELSLHVLNSFNSLICVFPQLVGLGVKALLVILFLLNVLALDDLLGLLGNSVELHVHCSFSEIENLEL